MRKVRRVPRKIRGDDEDEDVVGQDRSILDGDRNNHNLQTQQRTPAASQTLTSASAVVKRPQLSARTGSRVIKKGSSPATNKTSFAGTSVNGDANRDNNNQEDGNDDEDVSGGVSLSTLRTSKIGPASIHRDVLQRNASGTIATKPHSRLNISTSRLPNRGESASPDPQADRPSYSANYIAELRNLTPSAPVKTECQSPTSETSANELDIAAKFGTDSTALTLPYSDNRSSKKTHIPSAAEIREKKERRKRLAQESAAGNDYISLDASGPDPPSNFDSDEDNDDPRSRSLIIPADEIDIPSKHGESRLAHSDEDIAEGFDDFVEDSGRVVLSRSARKTQDKQRRKDIERQIKAAQHGYGYSAGLSSGSSGDEADGDGGAERKQSDDEDSNGGIDEDTARNKAYDMAQTRAGTYSMTSAARHEQAAAEARLQSLLHPPKPQPIPELKVVIARYRQMVQEKQLAAEAGRKKLEQLSKERAQIDVEEARVKDLLKEAAAKLESLTGQKDEQRAIEEGPQQQQPGLPNQRGLEGLSALGGVPPVSDATRNDDGAGQTLGMAVESKSNGEDDIAMADADTNSGARDFMQLPRGFAGMSAARLDDEDDYY